MRTSSAAIIAAMSLGVAGCASDAASLDTAPMSVVRAAQSSIAPAEASAPGEGPRAARRRSALPPRSAASAREVRTPAGPPRSRDPEPSTALPISDAPRLAAAACEQYMAARAGSYPAPVRARGEASALAIVTESVASAVLGMPVVAPAASRPARERLDDARARISRALAAGDDARATAIAEATAARIEGYARTLGIADCG